MFRQYEYEEEMYLSLDGTATVYVNSSIAGARTRCAARRSMRARRRGSIASRSAPTSTRRVTHVTQVSQSRRSNRRFVHVRMDVDDVRRLAHGAAVRVVAVRSSGSKRQSVRLSADGRRRREQGRRPTRLERRSEIVAFRLHLPSKIDYPQHRRDRRRGNILVWEQPLADRLRSVPLTLDARMQTQSILYRTLWLFAATFVGGRRHLRRGDLVDSEKGPGGVAPTRPAWRVRPLKLRTVRRTTA